MKSEIKDLYRKNPKLAKEVAKVLGYKVRAVKLDKPLVKRAEDSIKKAKDLVKNTLNEFYSAVEESGAVLSRKLEQQSFQAVSSLDVLLRAFKKL